MKNTYKDHYRRGDLIMWVDLSTYCNAGCPQCHRTKLIGHTTEDWLPLVQWSLQTFVEAFPINTLHHYARWEFCGTWGDPLMNKDLFGIVQYIIDNSTARIQINTNGSIRDANWWWDFGVMGGNRLQVWFDIDGTTQDMHSLYRQKTNLDKIKENVEAYCATNAEACAMTIVFKHNQDYLWDIHDMIRGLGVKGKLIFAESNRFYHQDYHDSWNIAGELVRLEQATLNGDHPLLNDEVPIRDHKWRKKFVADGNKTNDYW